MAETTRFYWQWFVRTVWRSPGTADGYAGLFGTAVGLAQHYRPALANMTASWLWQVPLWAFGAILLARFFTAPLAIWREDQAKLRLLDTQDARKAKRVALGSLIEEATNLLKAYRGQEGLDSIIAQTTDWRERALDVLDKQFDPSFRAHFLSDAGILSGEPTGMKEARMMRWRWVNYRTIRLQEFLAAL